MKASKLRIIWVAIMTLLYTLDTCIRSASKGLSGTCDRKWVDDLLQLWTSRVLKLIGATHEVFNPYHVKTTLGEPTIILCNHSSLYDIPFSLAAFPNNSLRMLAKKEMSRIPLMARAMRSAEFPFIDRKNRHQAIKDLEHVQHLLKSGIVMWIAPEGTRSNDGKVAPFKKGAFITAIQAKATLIPIGIRGAHTILPARTYELNLNQHVEIHIGQPIEASQYTLDNKEALMAEVHQRMTQLVEG